jgi:hypothetical protein
MTMLYVAGWHWSPLDYLHLAASLSATFTRPVRLAMVVQLAPAGSNPVEVGLGD